jgi:hypothetical protein
VEAFPSNSKEQKVPRVESAERKPNLKVVEGNVIVRKATLSTRMKQMFFGGDTKGVIEYVIGDVLVPAMKDMITDAVSQGMDRMIFGDAPRARRNNSRPNQFGSSHTNYARYAGGRRDDTPRRPNRPSHDFGGIVLTTRAEADGVLETLEDIISRYEFASVKDLYELVGADFRHTDEKWGWSDLTKASVSRLSSGGYELNLPRPEPIE